MPYASEMKRAIAGQWSKAGQSAQRATGHQNSGLTSVKAGRFVAFDTDTPGGIKEVSGIADVLAGVVVFSPVQSEYQADEYLSVGHIGVGDGIFCELEGDAVIGSKVYVRMVAKKDKPTGVITGVAVENETLETRYIILNVTEGLAEIGLPVA